jgi:hypothetical protein
MYAPMLMRWSGGLCRMVGLWVEDVVIVSDRVSGDEMN